MELTHFYGPFCSWCSWRWPKPCCPCWLHSRASVQLSIAWEKSENANLMFCFFSLSGISCLKFLLYFVIFNGSEKYTCTSGGLCCQAAIRGKCHWTAFRSLRIFPCIAIHTAANTPPCECSGLVLNENWNEWKLCQFDLQACKKWSCKRKCQRNNCYL